MGISGIGSWPGDNMRVAVEAVHSSVGELDAASGVRGLPYVPELPARGPGADMVGRTASLLLDLAIETQPYGWRLVDHPGRDHTRASALWRRDRDLMAELCEGYTGPYVLSFTGPWTLAAHLRLPFGERVIADAGAVRDVTQSLAEGIAAELRRWHETVPGAQWVVKLDEPSLPAVLAGSLSTSSGYRRHAAVGEDEATQPLAGLVSQVRRAVADVNTVKTEVDADTGQHVEGVGGDQRASVVVHCCASDVPVALLRRADVEAVSLDVSLLGQSGWEACAQLLDGGGELWAGLPVPLAGELPSARALADVLARPLHTLGLGDDVLNRLTLTPACGLAGAESVHHADTIHRRIIDAAKTLRDDTHG